MHAQEPDTDASVLAKRVGCHKKTVQRTLAKIQKGLFPENAARSGRPRSLTSNGQTLLKDLAKQNIANSSRVLSRQLNADSTATKKHVTPRTIP